MIELCPVLPEDGGLRWQWMRPDDIRSVASLVNQIEEQSGLSYRTSERELRTALFQSDEWLGAVAFDANGLPAAYIHQRLKQCQELEVRSNTALRHDCRDPQYEDVIADSQDHFAEYLARGRKAVVVTSSQHHGCNFERVLERHGFAWSSSLYEMRSSLAVLPDSVVISPFIEITQWRPDLADLIRLAALSFAPSHQDYEARKLPRWVPYSQDFAPSISYVALDKSTDRTRVAGFILLAEYKQDWAALGWQEGYIDLLEVGEEWRESAVARELVVAALRASKARGLDKVATALSSSHGAELLRLFGSLGFEGSDTEKFFVRSIPPK